MEFLVRAMFLVAPRKGTEPVPASNVASVASVARPRPRAHDESSARPSFELAATRAVAKLGDERCRQVYSDFRDRAGRTLSRTSTLSGEMASPSSEPWSFAMDVRNQRADSRPSSRSRRPAAGPSTSRAQFGTERTSPGASRRPC